MSVAEGPAIQVSEGLRCRVQLEIFRRRFCDRQVRILLSLRKVLKQSWVPGTWVVHAMEWLQVIESNTIDRNENRTRGGIKAFSRAEVPCASLRTLLPASVSKRNNKPSDCVCKRDPICEARLRAFYLTSGGRSMADLMSTLKTTRSTATDTRSGSNWVI